MVVWRSRAPERSGEMALAHTRLLSPRERAHPLALLGRSPRRPPCARPRKLFPRGSERRCEAFAAHARAPAAPSGAALGLRVGPVWKGFCFPGSPHFPHFVVAIGVRRRKESRAARLGVSGKLARRPCAPPCARPLAGHRARAGRTVRSFHRFALLLPLKWPESHHIRPRMFQSPGLSHSSSLSSSLTVSRQSPPLIHVIPWASFPSLNTGAPQPSWPAS